MKTSKAGIDLIKRWEGLVLYAYDDADASTPKKRIQYGMKVAGTLTIGYGHTSAAGPPKVEQGMTITEREAEEILARDLFKYEQGVISAITARPTQPQFDAMVSLCYNIGPGAFAKSSLVRRFNAGNIAEAADAFLMWNKAGGRVLKGLENRRKDERALFLKAGPATPHPKPVEPVPPIPPPAPETPPAATPVAGRGIAAVVLGALGALLAAYTAWVMGLMGGN